ncbi:hypothetical protein ABZX77_05320 [Streptomyces sp. NPDC004237]|uniref:hypothetical protein n=1 Tax=Streptomyces sp. NPDC004237 TaxID=3154455 RepID=UPI0033A2C73C
MRKAGRIDTAPVASAARSSSACRKFGLRRVAAEVAERGREFDARGEGGRAVGDRAPEGGQAGGPAGRYGELTADPVGEAVGETPSLLVLLRVAGGREAPKAEPARVTPVEGRGPALPAGGASTAQAARGLGLTGDGVTYRPRWPSARRDAANRTELVVRAYALGVLRPGAWPPAPTE